MNDNTREEFPELNYTLDSNEHSTSLFAPIWRAYMSAKSWIKAFSGKLVREQDWPCQPSPDRCARARGKRHINCLVMDLHVAKMAREMSPILQNDAFILSLSLSLSLYPSWLRGKFCPNWLLRRAISPCCVAITFIRRLSTNIVGTRHFYRCFLCDRVFYALPDSYASWLLKSKDFRLHARLYSYASS